MWTENIRNLETERRSNMTV